MENVSALPAPALPVARRSPLESLSRPVSAWVVMTATLLKELRIARRYVMELVGNFVDLGVRIVFYVLLSGVVAFQSPASSGQTLAGRDLFIFFQGGLLLMMFSGPTLWGPINTVRSDLYNGTLEFLYSNPGSRYAYYVGTVIAKVLINMVLFLPIYLILVLYSHASPGHMLMVLLACLTMLVALTALGIAFSLLVLVWRQVGPVAGVFNLVFEMLTGAYIPVAAFPQVVQYLVCPLPHTWGYDLIRYYSFEGNWQTILPVWQEWILTIVYAIIFTLVSRYLLSRAELLAKKTGLHVL